MAFKVGDKVFYKPLKVEGEVLFIDNNDKKVPYLVGFKGFSGHNGDGICIDIESIVERKGYKDQCWWCKEENLELAEEEKMKNIDVIAKDKDLIDVNNICILCYCLKYNKDSCHEMICCGDCEFFLAKNCIDFLNAEYKSSKIKLTKIEYDMLKTLERPNTPFYLYSFYMQLKKLGHFAGILDTNKTVKEILDNCEIID